MHLQKHDGQKHVGRYQKDSCLVFFMLEKVATKQKVPEISTLQTYITSF